MKSNKKQSSVKEYLDENNTDVAMQINDKGKGELNEYFQLQDGGKYDAFIIYFS